MRKLEIGSGNRPLAGYEHLDIDSRCPHVEYVCPMDAIPVENNTFDEIVSIHVIEHQPWKNTLKTLTEWVRVLKPGGSIRIETPNLRWIAKAYLDSRQSNSHNMFLSDAAKMTPGEKSHLICPGRSEYDAALWTNFKIMSGGGQWDQHLACYDATLLSALLLQAGLSKITRVIDGDTLIIEGRK